MKRRVVITGMGALTPVGLTAAETWRNIRAGVCGIAPITSLDVTEHKVKLAGEVKGLDVEAFIPKKDAHRMCRFTQLALIASLEAFGQAGLDMSREDPSRCGVIVSSGVGGLDFIEHEHDHGLEKGFDRVSPFFIPMVITNMAAGTIAIRHGFRGMCSSVVTACAGGTNALGDAFRQIRDGYADVMLCGGTESCITPLGLGGFTSMRALCESNDPARASIPFDRQRSGFVMGEGAGILCLEEYEHAAARGAAILGEVAGYGATCDAHHMTAPAEDGAGAAACMVQAIADAGIAPADIGYINAHGTSTPLNDKCETAAIKAALGSRAKQIPVSSTKSMTGHMLGAAGAVEAIITASALRDGFVPPTANYRVPDEECDLDVVPNTGRSLRFEYALSDSLGFGGHNAAVVLRRFGGE